MTPKKKYPVNLAIFFVTIFTLFVTVSLTDNFAIKIFNEFSVDVDGFNIDMPIYTEYEDTSQYLSSSVTFEPKAMAGFYDLTRSLLNSILPPNFLKEDMIEFTQNGDGFVLQLSDKVSISDLLNNEWQLLFLIAVIIVIALVIPITGLVFCCCRCCGNCGATSEPSDKKTDSLKKIILGGLVVICGTFLLFTIVCAFSTNQQMEEGTDTFPNNIRKSHKDASTYLESTMNQADNLLVQNFGEFSDRFKDTMQNAGKNVLEQMDSWENASAILDVYSFLEELPIIKDNVTSLNTKLEELTATAAAVEKGLEDLKLSLKTTLNGCIPTIPQCESANEQIDELKFTLDQFPDVSTTLNELIDISNTPAFQNAASTGKANLEQIEQKINETLVDSVNLVSEQIEKAGTEIKNNLNSIKSAVENIKTEINNANSTLEKGYSYIKTYSPYFYYVGLTISCILLFILVCIVLGLVFGVFGKRPEKYQSNSCTKETGSMFLISGILLIFIFTIIIGLLTCVMLLFGLAVDRGVCYPLRNPNDSTIINIIDEYISKNNKVDLQIQFKDILIKCRKNESIYQVFNLDTKVNLTDLINKFDVDEYVAKIIETITIKYDEIIDSSTFNILDATNLETLERLIGINLDIGLADFEQKLNKSFTTIDLQVITQSLEGIINTLDPNIFAPTLSQLEKNIQDIKNFEETSLKLLTNEIKETLILAESVDNNLKMNSTSFSEAIKKFLDDVDNAQQQIKADAKQLIPAATAFGDLAIKLVESYLYRVINVTTYELGQCGPLNIATDSVLIATCDKIVLPWNGFWVSLFISLLLFVPTIILSISLSSLYKKYKMSKQYAGGQRFKVGKPSKKGKNHIPYPSAGPGRFPPDSRYDDMAPNINPNSRNNEISTRF